MGDGQLSEAAKARRDAEARAAYLANQQAVAATPVDDRRWTVWRVLALVSGTVFLGFYIATVVYYFNLSDETVSSLTLPTIDSITALLTVWLILLPWLLETRTVGRRVRNLVVAVVLTAILFPVGVPVFVELGSLVAYLISDVLP